MASAVQRRLLEEMGIIAQPEFAYKFQYRAALENNLIEHELDHVYVGLFNGEPIVNPSEVEDWKYASLHEIKKDAGQNPDLYTYWFKLILNHPEIENSGLAIH